MAQAGKTSKMQPKRPIEGEAPTCERCGQEPAEWPFVYCKGCLDQLYPPR